jgi:hypothetical protein
MYSLRSYDLTQAADVAANARGEISARQRAAFNEVARAAKRPALIMIGLIMVLFACPILQTWQSPDTLTNKIGITAMAIIVISLIILVPFLRERSRAIKFRQELQAGIIVQTEGEIRWQWGRAVALTLRADRELQSIYGPLTLPPGQYRFYYLAKSGGMLSAEKMANVVKLEDA